MTDKISGLVQERHNSIANALELRLSCTNPSKWGVQAYAEYPKDCIHTKIAPNYRFEFTSHRYAANYIEIVLNRLINCLWSSWICASGPC